MKTNQLLLAIACMAACVTSCQQKVEEKKSFAQIIQDDPSRRQELLEEAKKLQETSTGHQIPQTLSAEDELTPAELYGFRSNAGYDEDSDKKFPTVIVAVTDMLGIIGNHTGVKDSLIFYKGKYPKADIKRIKRYNDKFANGQNAYTYKMLKNRKTFVIQLYPPDKDAFLKAPVYDIGRLCPPPPVGCN